MGKIKIQFKIQNLFLIGTFIFGLFFFISPAEAEWANHLVISEVQITGGPGKTTNDFIELYNPTESAINLNGYRLVKRTKTGTSDILIKSWTDDIFVPAHGFYLWANSGYVDIPVMPDASTTASIADDNGIALRFGPNDTGEIIDSLAWGDCQNIFAEKNTTSTLPANPGFNQSLERKPGGESGNGQDTNDNYNDFFFQDLPHPQNSQSPVKPPISQGPICGNGIKEEGEECDGNDLDNQTCQSRGFSIGTLSCNLNCTFNTSACSSGGSGGGSYILTYQPQSGDVVINEIFPEPDLQKDENEWIEIYNKTNQTIDLTEWTIEDNTGQPKSLSNRILAAKSYCLLNKGEHFSFSLNNSGDILILKYKGQIIDQVTYGDFEDGNLEDNAPRPGKSKSISRNSESQDTNNDKNDFSLSKNVTPGAVNEIELFFQPDENSSDDNQNFQVLISEFLANPEGLDSENEWIEIYNFGQKAVDLSGWQIDDAEGGSQPYKFPEGTKIEGGSYLVLTRQQTKITLNNTFDSVRLIGPNGQILQRIDYQKPPEGASYARNDFGEWFYTNVLTPGLPNIFEIESDEDKESLSKVDQKLEKSEIKDNENMIRVSIDELSNLEKNDKVIIQGVVIAPPNLFAKTYFYLNGAQIYSAKGEFPDLKVGDLVEVDGVLSEAFNQKRIKIKKSDQIKVLSHNNQISAKHVVSDELSEELAGYLVEVSGQVIEKVDSKIYLDDGQGEIEIYIRPKIGIDKKSLKEGQELKVTGILVESKNGWQILPRWQRDIIIVDSKKENRGEIENQVTELMSQPELKIQNLESSVAKFWPESTLLKYLTVSATILTIIFISLVFKIKGILK